MLDEAEESLRAWAATAERAWHDDRDIAEALQADFGLPAGLAPEQRERLETLNGIHSNAAGLKRWLETRHEHPH
jgi:hypothetical protein